MVKSEKSLEVGELYTILDEKQTNHALFSGCAGKQRIITGTIRQLEEKIKVSLFVPVDATARLKPADGPGNDLELFFCFWLFYGIYFNAT